MSYPGFAVTWLSLAAWMQKQSSESLLSRAVKLVSKNPVSNTNSCLSTVAERKIFKFLPPNARLSPDFLFKITSQLSFRLFLVLISNLTLWALGNEEMVVWINAGMVISWPFLRIPCGSLLVDVGSWPSLLTQSPDWAMRMAVWLFELLILRRFHQPIPSDWYNTVSPTVLCVELLGCVVHMVLYSIHCCCIVVWRPLPYPSR